MSGVKVPPPGGAAVLGRNVGQGGGVKGAAVLHRDALDHGAVGHKGQRHGRESLGQILLHGQGGKVVKGEGLGLPGIADAVDAAQCLADKVVAGLLALAVLQKLGQGAAAFQPAGNGADPFLPVGQHHAAAVGEGAAAAGNAAHIAAAVQTAFGAALPDGRLALPGNAAHVIGGILGEIGKVCTLHHGTHVHAAHNAARALLFDGDGAGVGAAAQDDAAFIGGIEGTAARDPGVVLGVQIVLPRHGTGDAARVDVGVDGARVGAVEHLAFGVAVGVTVRHILKQGVVAGILRCTQQGIADLVDLVGDGLDVLDQGLGVVAGVGVQGTHAVHDGGQAAVEAAACRRDGIPVVELNAGYRQGQVAVDGQAAVVADTASHSCACTGLDALVNVHIQGGGIAAGTAVGEGSALGPGVIGPGSGITGGGFRLGRGLGNRSGLRGGGVGGFGGSGGLRHGRRFRSRFRFRRGGGFRGDVDVHVGGGGAAAGHTAAHAAGGGAASGELGQVGEGDVLGADVDTVGHLFQQGIHRIAGGGHPVLQVGQLAGQLAGGGRGIRGRLVHQPLKGVELTAQLLQGILIVLQDAGRLHLAHDAAALLAGVDLAVVDAALDVAGLAAGDAAHVVADVLVSHRSAVDTGPDDACRVARNPADVGDVGGALGLEQIFQGQVFQIDFVLADGGVDARVVGAGGDDAVVLACGTADEVTAVNTAADRAAGEDAGHRVDAGNAADLGGAGHGAVKGAVFDGTGVLAGNAAHRGAGPGRADGAADVQIPHDGSLLDVAEKPLYTAAAGEGQTGNDVILAFQIAAEAGDPFKIHSGQVDVGIQQDSAVPAPAVQPAVLRQLQQIVGSGNVESFLHGRSVCLRQGRDGQSADRQTKAQGGGKKAFCKMFHYSSSPSV